TSLGVRQAAISDWKAEIGQWHASTALIDTVYHEPIDAERALAKVLQDYLLDMWWDPVDRLIKLTAISVWKDTSGDTLEEGKHINYQSLRVKPLPDKHFTRAFIWYNKPNKVANDDVENYRNVSLYTNATLEGTGLYGEPKTKAFDPSVTLSTNQADLLVQRTVSRFGFVPFEYSWTTEERFLDFEVGDVREISSPELQDADGANKVVRAQILSIQPQIDIGRSYKCKALSYEAAFADDEVFTLTGTIGDKTLHTLAGAPSTAVDVTFVLDGAVVGSSANGTSLQAGPFASGSTITIILINNADWQAAGGRGGGGGEAEEESGTVIFMGAGNAGAAGGICYDAQGVDTDIYLGGTVGSYTALGTLKAPGGGGGGQGGGQNSNDPYGGGGGGGGAGRDLGLAGAGGAIQGAGGAAGSAGSNGDAAGSGGAGGSG
ncbi:hypothetical protein KC976_04630, partial [Candidatus Saccharibacteria bacterium]|nr:hypothetical protein [Candidatus Saccharibacteria bacterium]